jgi:GNAT superfamily N-acetyltransferase
MCAAALSINAPIAAQNDEAASLVGLAAADLRVAAVSYRILAAAPPICTKVAPTIGLSVHDVRQYQAALRPAATRAFGFVGYPAVLAVAPGGPADRAGVHAGDAVTAIAGVPVAQFTAPGPDRRPQGIAEADDVGSRVATASANGEVALDLLRGGVALSVRIAPVAACDMPVQLEPGTRYDAWSDGRSVALTSALAGEAADDDELAFVIAHEAAHNILGHRDLLRGRGIGRGLLSRIGAKGRAVRQTEEEADRLGLYLAARAGYDPQAAVRFWQDFGRRHSNGIFADATHPGWQARAAALQATSDEILTKRAHGEPLTP